MSIDNLAPLQHGSDPSYTFDPPVNAMFTLQCDASATEPADDGYRTCLPLGDSGKGVLLEGDEPPFSDQFQWWVRDDRSITIFGRGVVRMPDGTYWRIRRVEHRTDGWILRTEAVDASSVGLFDDLSGESGVTCTPTP